MTDLGLDSVSAVDLSTRLGARTGLDLPASLAFDHPTSTAIARHLLAALRTQGLTPESGQDAGTDGGTEGGKHAGIRAAEGTVFGALARLEASVDRDRPDAAARDRLVERLRALTARLTEGPAGGPSADDTSIGDRIGEATTVDQLFDLIDNELKGP